MGRKSRRWKREIRNGKVNTDTVKYNREREREKVKGMIKGGKGMWKKERERAIKRRGK